MQTIQLLVGADERARVPACARASTSSPAGSLAIAIADALEGYDERERATRRCRTSASSTAYVYASRPVQILDDGGP